MTRYLLLAAALLLPVLAYAAAPTANLAVQIVTSGSNPPPSGSVACDIGPSYTGSIPAAAAQAGFTHCAANYDFTQTQSWTDAAGTHQWSNLSTWFDCNASSTDASKLLYYEDNGQPWAVPCDTSHFNIVNDGGTQAWAQSFYLSDMNAGKNNDTTITGLFVGSSNVTATPFPEQYYYEMVLRPLVQNPCSNNCINFDISSYAVNAVQSPCFISADFDEVFSNTSNINTGTADWPNNCYPPDHFFMNNLSAQAPSPTASGYSTYGNLVTMDGVAQASQCNYYSNGAVNGLTASAFLSCAATSVVPPMTTGVFNGARMGLYILAAPQGEPINGGSHWTATQQTWYIQRITMWVCSNPTGGTNWRTQNTTCYNNPVITTHP